MLRLCDAGALWGGLSVALDVRPDELLGALCAALGGQAMKLKAVDVEDGPPMRLSVHFIDHQETWELEDLYALALSVNDLLKDDPTSKVAAILGEWDDSLQLWCVEKSALSWLLGEDFFAPRNHHQLAAMQTPAPRRGGS